MAFAITRGWRHDGFRGQMHMTRILGVVHMAHDNVQSSLLHGHRKRHVYRHGVA